MLDVLPMHPSCGRAIPGPPGTATNEPQGAATALLVSTVVRRSAGAIAAEAGQDLGVYPLRARPANPASNPTPSLRSRATRFAPDYRSRQVVRPMVLAMAPLP